MIGAMNDRGSCGWNLDQAGLVTVVLQKKMVEGMNVLGQDLVTKMLRCSTWNSVHRASM
jgi:hypothetical protein